MKCPEEASLETEGGLGWGWGQGRDCGEMGSNCSGNEVSLRGRNCGAGGTTLGLDCKPPECASRQENCRTCELHLDKLKKNGDRTIGLAFVQLEIRETGEGPDTETVPARQASQLRRPEHTMQEAG